MTDERIIIDEEDPEDDLDNIDVPNDPVIIDDADNEEEGDI